MRRLRDLRIVRWELKLAAVIGVWLAGTAVMWLLPDAVPEILRVVVGSVVFVGSFLLCARVFRGRGESVGPPRAWWRMTARVRLSAWLGSLFAVLALWLGAVLLLSVLGIVPTALEDQAGSAVVTVELGAIAFLYLNSAARLRTLPPLPVEPRFRTPRTLR